jgi:secondary thiamine-phosphate synthase enzyme
VFHQQTISIKTAGRGSYDITDAARDVINKLTIDAGLLNIFVTHTSASLMITENADADVRRDLETVFSRLAPDGDRAYHHDAEGPDDMSAHIRSVLTQVSITIPFKNQSLQLGTWQGIYLWEHRTHPHTRELLLSVTG